MMTGIRSLGWGLLILSMASLGPLYAAYDYLVQPLPTRATVEVTIPAGEPLAALATRLKHREVIERVWAFRWLSRWTGSDRRLQAGRYRIGPGHRPLELLERLVQGDVYHHRITLIPGWTYQTVLEELRAHPGFRSPLADPAPFDHSGVGHPEGLVLPETYYFSPASSPADLLRRAHRTLWGFLHAEWDRRQPDLPLDTPYEALVLASIIEKETGQADERPVIASVFINRLRRGMRLQSDPTVIYGLGEGFDGDLTRADLRRPTAYNTYVHSGLPPTPIALASRASIRAALQPATTEYLYFVARGDGSHVFSENLVDHNRAVDRYQRRP